jgi:hypothetical protein
MRRAARALLGAAAYAVGMTLGGMMVAILHLPTFPPMPGENRPPAMQFLIMVLAAPLLTAALVPLAEGMRGPWWWRWAAIAWLLFVTLGLNTVIELTVFSTQFPDGDVRVSALFLPASLILAAVMTWHNGTAGPSTLAPVSLAGWPWRLVTAWLAFPAIYFVFGLAIAWIVVPHYEAGVATLRVPPLQAVLLTQFARSVFFLAASLPFALLWARSRTALVVGLGLAHTFAVGVFPLLQADFMPAVLRITHSVEIAADSFAYAAVLAMLFIARAAAREAPLPSPLA